MYLFAHFSRFCAGIGGLMSKNIAILASGNGTNAENIIRYFQNSESVNIGLVLANRETALVLERARSLNVPFACMGKTEWVNGTAVLALLEERGIDFIVLAGFLARIPDCILHAYPNKIINIHPSLLPKFGGKGMYGDRVHEAVVAAGETETGITIHYLMSILMRGKSLCSTDALFCRRIRRKMWQRKCMRWSMSITRRS